MLKRSHYITLGLVAALALVILNLPARTSSRLKIALGSLFLPLFGLVGASQQATGKAATTLTSRAELEHQNEALTRENLRLKTQASQTDELLLENNRLRQLLQWKQRSPWDLKLGQVILRDPANWWHTVWINLGSDDGVQENQPVLTSDGLVGKIKSVGAKSAQVVLLGDPGCTVSARILETRDAGIIGTGGPFDTSLAQLVYLPRGAKISPGQKVVTSGEGGVFPKGILIGLVMDSRPAEFGLYTEARVKLAVDLATLEEVWVKLK